MKKIWPFLLIFAVVLVFFYQLILGKWAIPSDTIIGLYHPFRDLLADQFPNGIPFKNFLITDPVRQQLPWRFLVIEAEKMFNLPLWNPYSFSGTPLLANFQSASFYPFNFIFLLLPFNLSWNLLVVLQLLLGGIFLHLYLRNLRLNIYASLMGAFTFVFSGFSVAWLEWNTILHTAVWLPLILLSLDKIFKNSGRVWYFLLFLSLVFSFFAGHLQTFFYLFIFSLGYFVARIIVSKNYKKILPTLVSYFAFLVVTLFQWFPTLKFILLSARDLDQSAWQSEGWFIPWQNLVQFIAPDFFGNPTTLNYWGVWNYAEFVGYVGILGIIMAFFALFFRKDRKVLFFGITFFLSLIFALPTYIAKLPFILDIPFISTSQPTRLLFITDFSLAVLAALGIDRFLKNRKGFPIILGVFVLVFMILWIFVLLGNQILSAEQLQVSKNNLIFPSLIFFPLVFFFILYLFIKNKLLRKILLVLVFLVFIFDILRFSWKFTPFTKTEYLFPQTKITEFIKKDKDIFRVMTTDSRIFPPNFSVIYKIQSIDGYDPLYLRRYAELIAASERGEPNIDPPFGFNRIITPHNYDSKIIDLLGVKYILSLEEIESDKLKKVLEEGQTKVYLNIQSFPRVFFVSNTISVDKEEAIEELFKENLEEAALVEEENMTREWGKGKVEIKFYRENEILLTTESNTDGFLVLTDSYYPTWKAEVDGKDSRIYRTDFNFRGIVVPKGKHQIRLSDSLL